MPLPFRETPSVRRQNAYKDDTKSFRGGREKCLDCVGRHGLLVHHHQGAVRRPVGKQRLGDRRLNKAVRVEELNGVPDRVEGIGVCERRWGGEVSGRVERTARCGSAEAVSVDRDVRARCTRFQDRDAPRPVVSECAPVLPFREVRVIPALCADAAEAVLCGPGGVRSLARETVDERSGDSRCPLLVEEPAVILECE